MLILPDSFIGRGAESCATVAQGRALVLQPDLWWSDMFECIEYAVTPSVMTDAGLLALGSTPQRPGQMQLRRTRLQRQRDFQQTPHFRYADFGQRYTDRCQLFFAASASSWERC